MPMIAVAAAALAMQAAPQIETTVRPIEGGQVVRLSYSDLASVTSPPPPARTPGGLSTPDVRLSGSDYAWETGVRTIAVSTGAGSISQAATNLNVQMTILESSK